MRLKTFVRCSASAAVLALTASPAWAQTGTPDETEVQPEAAETDPMQPTEEENVVVVTGIRQSLQSAQNIRRNSDAIVDAIVAEDIGKLPDITASAALARVTGVQVNRSAGEAAQVQVRGLPDISTTYNGREIFTAENRFVSIQDFPAGAVAALEVYKSGTANLIEGGIGGQVNVRSRRPFDFDGLEISGSLNGVFFEQSDQPEWNGNLLLSDRWDTSIGEMGVLVNFAMTNIDFLDSTREADRFMGMGPGGFVHPNGIGIFFGSGNRWRPSVNAAFQWRPTPELELYADFLFQGYRGEDSNFWQFVPLFDNSTFTNVVLFPGTNRARSLTASNASTPDGFSEFRDTRTDTYQAAVGGIYRGERFRLSADIAYTDSTFAEQQLNVDYALSSSPVRDVSFDIEEGPGGAVVDYRDFNTADPNNYLFRGLFDRNYEATGNDIQARADLVVETGLSFIPEVQVGARINDREAGRRGGSRYSFQLPRGLFYRDLGLDIGHIGPGFVYDNFQPERTFVAPSFESVFANRDQLRTLVGFQTGPAPFSDLETFSANETAYAGYGQLRYEFDIGFPVDGLVGLRAVRTETEVTGTSLDVATGTRTLVSAINEYTDYLPNVSARLQFMPGLQARLAYTETRTRPNFDQLNPATTFDPLPGACTPVPGNPSTGPDSPGCRQTTFGGNPNLEPLESTNYDLALEYYFARTGSLIVSLFRRDTRNFIFRTVRQTVIPNAPDLFANVPFNSGEGRLEGVEVAFTTFFDFDWLPEWARGFGVQANYTYIDGSTELSPDFQAQLPGQQPVPFVSEHSYNLVGIYERGGFSSRLAYNWRSDFVIEYQDIQGVQSPLMQDSLGTLDFSASYSPFENVTIALDVLNILAEPIGTYRAFNAAGDTYPFQRKYLERVYSLGVRFRF